jgi:hypothetical protein
MVRRQHGHALGHLGHGFLCDPNDPKAGTGARFGFLALGHLGHLVIDLKSARDAALSAKHGFIGINPYIKIFYFLN